MIPASNRKRFKKVLSFKYTLFASVLIHGAFFLFLLYPFQTYKKIKNIISPQYQSIKIIHSFRPTEKIDKRSKNSNYPPQKSKNIHKEKAAKKTSLHSQKKHIAITGIDISEKNQNHSKKEGEKIESQKTINLAQNNIKNTPSKKVTQIQKNPFGYLKLPNSLLGQNLFPRKYDVFIKINKINNQYLDIELERMISLQNKKAYLDKTIESSFAYQLKKVSNSDLKKWLDTIMQTRQMESHVPNHSIETETISLVLEFHEPN